MGGIVGFNWDDKRLLKSMTSCISHRGPDKEGHYSDNYISLGNRRLKITGQSSKSNQPIYNEDGSILLVFNGEVYNHKELREELKNKKHKFKSDSDTEAIIHAYEEWGHACVKKLNGMFAFALYDSNKKELFIARDRLGIKPLYYYNKDRKFIFGSELKALMEAGIKKEINKNAISLFISYNYIPNPSSILAGIYKLPQGSYMVYNLRKKMITKLEKYWEPNFNDKLNWQEKDIINGIREHLDNSVKRRIAMDVPVGAFLSGGLASSALAATILKFKDNLHTFSVGFDKPGYDEARHANLVSKKLGTEHHKMHFNSTDVAKAINDLAYYNDEPLGDISIVPTYLVSKIARKFVEVALSGDGGLEAFGGYKRYINFRLMQCQKKMPNFMNRSIIAMANAQKIFHNSMAMEKTRANLETYEEPDYKRYATIMENVSSKAKSKIVADRTINVMDTASIYKKYFGYEHYLDNAMNADLNTYIPDNILAKLDRASMAVSLETRVPFLDHESVEFTSRIPIDLKVKRLESRYILKKALKPMLPKKILSRKQQDFVLPLKEYFKHDLKYFVEGILLSRNCKRRDVYNPKFVSNILRRHYKGVEDHSQMIFSMMQLELFFKRWIDDK